MVLDPQIRTDTHFDPWKQFKCRLLSLLFKIAGMVVRVQNGGAVGFCFDSKKQENFENKWKFVSSLG